MATSKQLWMACRDKEEDESGKAYWYDYSADCYHFHELKGGVGRDWGVCTNPKSPRVGLLTFEHMGCEFYESSYRQMGQDHCYQREEYARQSRKRR
jgi:hypothetical protein